MTCNKLLNVGVAASSIALLTSLAVAQTAEAPPAVVLTAEEAIAIALKIQPGTIGEAELDEYEGKPAYDIEVVNAAGDEIEFKVDAATGEILNEWVDDDPSDDPVPGAVEETTN